MLATLTWSSAGFRQLASCHSAINDLAEYISLRSPSGPGVLFQSVSLVQDEEKSQSPAIDETPFITTADCGEQHLQRLNEYK